MNDYLEDDYSGLMKIVEDTIKEARETGNEHYFDMIDFRGKMEKEFTKLGFRDNEQNGRVDNILLVGIGALGEFIISTGIIREIRFNYANARITIVVNRRVYPMVECCPYVNEILLFDDSIVKKNILEVLAYIANFSQKYLWKKHFKVGFVTQYNARPWHLLGVMLLYVGGVKERIGYISYDYLSYTGNKLPPNENPGQILLTHSVIHPKKMIHACSRLFHMLKDFGLCVQNTELELWYTLSDKIKAVRLLRELPLDRITVAVGINANVPYRKYPLEKWLSVLKKLVDREVTLIILGGPAEAEYAKFLQKNLPGDFVLNLVEILPGRRVEAAILNEMTDVYIGNFTGTADMAMTAHIPCIMLSPHSKEFEKSLYELIISTISFPWQTNAISLSPKYSITEPENGSTEELQRVAYMPHTIDQIEPEEIVAAFDEMMHFMKNSPLRLNNSSPTIRTINRAEQLKYLF